MTNSEAAKCLEYIRFYMEGGECWTDAEFEAMDMAIEALRSATDINVATKEPKIIRCRDCKFWVCGYITDNDDFIPAKCGKDRQMVGHSSFDYCSYAEVKNVENKDK